MFSRVQVLILAAGKSSRAGMHKGLIPYQNKTWLEHQILCLKNIGLHNISMVVSAQTQIAYQAVLEKYQIQKILNSQTDAEKFDSVFVGLQNMSEDAVFLIPIDVPVAHDFVWQKLFQNFLTSSCDVRVPEFQNRGGHPVLLKQNFIQKILQDQKKTYQRLDHWILNSNVERILVEDPQVIQNMNHLADFSN